MTEKERLYKLYTAKYLENKTIDANGESLEVIRVPGGWIINKVFVPYDNEKAEYVLDPSDEFILIRCGNQMCSRKFEARKKEDFHGQIYNCPECRSTLDLRDFEGKIDTSNKDDAGNIIYQGRRI